MRLMVQVGFTALTNANFAGFVRGSIYTGNTKLACVPGLNCYSCPGALGSCPIGSLQAVITNRDFNFSYYIVGLLVMFGAVLGRFICGWLCPFGLVQDLIYKIPFFKKRKTLPGDKWLKYLKYVILLLFVIILPLLVLDIVGQGSPWFCKYICPSGTLMAGLPLYALNDAINNAVGGMFAWKVGLLGVLLLLSLWVFRPFCRYLCPLGAIYGLFNPVSLYKYSVDNTKCTRCGACQTACNFDIKVYEKPNSMDCIRCGDCKRACPVGAIRSGFGRGRK